MLADGQPLFASVVTGGADGYVAVGRATAAPAKRVGPAASSLPVLLRATTLEGGGVGLAWTNVNGVSGAVVQSDGTIGTVSTLLPDAGNEPQFIARCQKLSSELFKAIRQPENQ